MLGLGMGEILVLALVALVVVGPERLPKLMREMGRYYGQLRRAADELRRSFVLEADRQDAAERYERIKARRKLVREERAAAVAAAEEGEDPNADPPDMPHPQQVPRRVPGMDPNEPLPEITSSKPSKP